MTEPTYGGLTAAQLWQAINEAGAAEMCINARVLEELLKAVEWMEDDLIYEKHYK